jgi:hypothetical protein
MKIKIKIAIFYFYFLKGRYDSTIAIFDTFNCGEIERYMRVTKQVINISPANSMRTISSCEKTRFK